MLKDLTSQELALAGAMSDISERCYCAGWMLDLEYALWDAVLHGEKKYGHDTISQEDIAVLRSLSTAANAWIVFHDETEEMAVQLSDWIPMFQKDFQERTSRRRSA